jgi:hypothetical protein
VPYGAKYQFKAERVGKELAPEPKQRTPEIAKGVLREFNRKQHIVGSGIIEEIMGNGALF